MLYKLRPFVFNYEGSIEPVFPNDCEVVVSLAPELPFGGATGLGRTVSEAADHLTFVMDLDRGETLARNDQPFDPVNCVLELTGKDGRPIVIRLQGNQLTLAARFDEYDSLITMLKAMLYVLPPALSLEYLDTPYVTSIAARVGGVSGYLQRPASSSAVERSSTVRQQEHFIASVLTTVTFSDLSNYTLYHAVEYFFTACRLLRSGKSEWEFMAEALVNFAKCLECLFPASGDQESRDSARQGLDNFGLQEHERDRLVGVMVLRSSLDGAHPKLHTFEAEELSVIHEFAQRCEEWFRDFLSQAVKRARKGTWTPSPYEVHESSSSRTIAFLKLLLDETKANE